MTISYPGAMRTTKIRLSKDDDLSWSWNNSRTKIALKLKSGKAAYIGMNRVLRRTVLGVEIYSNCWDRAPIVDYLYTPHRYSPGVDTVVIPSMNLSHVINPERLCFENYGSYYAGLCRELENRLQRTLLLELDRLGARVKNIGQFIVRDKNEVSNGLETISFTSRPIYKSMLLSNKYL